MQSIELKIIFIFVFFTTIVLGVEHYQLSDYMMKQYKESKEAKNSLLIETISPVISLNLSLDLNTQYKEYLNKIIKKNADIDALHLYNTDNKILFSYEKDPFSSNNLVKRDFNYIERQLVDSMTQIPLAKLELYFSANDYDRLIHKSTLIGIQTSIIIFILLLFFIILVKRELSSLKTLRNNLLAYDPTTNNFPNTHIKSKNEVGLITNAIVTMVDKINMHTTLMDTLNASLEEKVKERTLELEHTNKELQLLASTDPLTQLYNRRYFIHAFEHILSLAKRNNSPLSIIMFDIDFFKRINDTYGHSIGDEVIISFVTLLKNSTRESDILCRFGGEEFLILLPKTDIQGAKIIASKIRESSQKDEVAVSTVKKTDIFYTVSAGVVEMDIANKEDIQTALKRVDDLLYIAKENGRNRIES